MPTNYSPNLNLRLPDTGDIGWDQPLNENIVQTDAILAQILAGNGIAQGLAPTDGGALDIDYAAGAALIDQLSFAIDAGSASLTASVTNWLFVDNAGAVQVDTVTPTGHFALIAAIDAGSTTIERISDLRFFRPPADPTKILYTPANYSPGAGTLADHLTGIDAGIGFAASMRRNAIINGNFEIAQRGTSQTTSGYGSIDRWYGYHAGSTKTMSRQAFTIGQIAVPGNPKYYCRTVVTSSAGASNGVMLKQCIESVSTYAEEEVTLSIYAKADAAKNIAIELMQSFGTGGAPSADVTQFIGTCALTSSWQWFTFVFTVPSISGKTLGTAGDDTLKIQFWFDAGSDYNSRTNSLGQQSGTFDIARVQIEEGSTATPFEIRPFLEELILCQRFYETSYHFEEGHFPGAITTFGSSEHNAARVAAAFTSPIIFKERKRATPTVVIYNPVTGASSSIRDTTASTNVAINSLANIGRTRVLYLNAAANSVDGNYYLWHWTADAELS